ncbi:MAG: putative porin [Cellvibrio sp.]|uniref:putative porin n=1 Tax=Cellvibrio sp. TaxID=1965322 RepID=UPI0031A8F3AE
MKPIIYSAIFATSSFALAPFAASDTYRNEIYATYSELDEVDEYSINLQGKHYFSAVDTTGLPLAEAAFLQKSSSVTLAASNNNYKSDNYENDTYARSLNVNYFIPNSIFFVGAGVSQQKHNIHNFDGGDDAGVYDYSTDWGSNLNARIGVAPIEGLQIWSDFYENSDISDYWNLSAKYVKPLSNERAVSTEVYYSDNDYGPRTVIVSADYYFTHRFSVGVGAARFMYDGDYRDDTNSYHVRARHFVTENISADLTYFSSDYSDSWMIGGTFRF